MGKKKKKVEDVSDIFSEEKEVIEEPEDDTPIERFTQTREEILEEFKERKRQITQRLFAKWRSEGKKTYE